MEQVPAVARLFHRLSETMPDAGLKNLKLSYCSYCSSAIVSPILTPHLCVSVGVWEPSHDAYSREAAPAVCGGDVGDNDLDNLLDKVDDNHNRDSIVVLQAEVEAEKTEHNYQGENLAREEPTSQRDGVGHSCDPLIEDGDVLLSDVGDRGGPVPHHGPDTGVGGTDRQEEGVVVREGGDGGVDEDDEEERELEEDREAGQHRDCCHYWRPLPVIDNIHRRYDRQHCDGY